MPKDLIQTPVLDANESAFFARELEFIKARSYDVKYPELKATRLIPVSTDAGSGAASITYEQYDTVGIFKVISNYGNDLPRADVKGEQFTVDVKSLGGSYGYNLQEIREAQMAGKPLTQRKANAARRGNDQKVERIAWSAYAADNINGGLVGLLYNPNIPSSAVGAGASSGHTLWINAGTPANVKTPTEIVKDMSDARQDVISTTNGVEVPDTMLMDYDHFGLISNTRMSTGTDTTVKEFFLRNNPGMTIEPVIQMGAVNPKPSGGAGPIDIFMVYVKSPDHLTLELPQPFEQLPVEKRGLEFVVDCHSRIGGVIIYYPLSINIKEGI